MTKDTEPFLSRWSRLKRQGGESDVPAPVAEQDKNAPPLVASAKPADAPLPELPPIDQLTPDSDFRPFMDPRVPDALRRMALKKLYADPHFNVQDMLDDYAGDYTALAALPAGMAGKLAHARRTLLGQSETDALEAAEQEAARAAAAGEESAPRETVAAQQPAATPDENFDDPQPPADAERPRTG